MTDPGRSSLSTLLACDEELLFQKFLSAALGAGLLIDEARSSHWRSVLRDLMAAIRGWCEERGPDEAGTGAEFMGYKPCRQLGARLCDTAHYNGIAFAEFFPVFKLIGQACIVFLQDQSGSFAQSVVLRRLLDMIEDGLCSRWLEVEAGHYQKELRQARYHLLHEKRRYFVVFQRMAEPAFVVDDRLRIIDVNQACLEFFGASHQELFGRACCDLLGREVCQACTLEEALAAQTSFSNIEVSVTVGVKKKTVLMNGTFLGDINHECPGILVILKDITEKKATELALRESEEKYRSRLTELVEARTEELRTANLHLQREVAVRERAEEELTELATHLQRSNRELEQFAHVASHDLKEPLLLIIAFCEKLIDRCYLSLDSKGRQYVDRIQRSAGKMQALIDDLLQLSRIARSESALVPIDLNTLMQEVVDDLGEQVKKVNATIKLSVLHDLEGDQVHVRQLFQNIIANALKFNKENRPPVVQVYSRLVENGMCEIMVEDNGIGFDEKHLARIFTPFERLHPRSKYEGSGIGLATCSSIAARHGGEITARSVPGKGSVFIVRLPQHPASRPRKKG